MEKIEKKIIKFENFLIYEKILLWISILAFLITFMWSLLDFFTNLLPHGKIIILPIVFLGVGILCIIISLTSALCRYYTER